MVRELLAGQVESARGSWPDGVSRRARLARFRRRVARTVVAHRRTGHHAGAAGRSGPPPAPTGVAGGREVRHGVPGRRRPSAGQQRVRCGARPGRTHPGRVGAARRRHGAGRRAVADQADLRRRVPGRRPGAGAARAAAVLRCRRDDRVRRSGPVDLCLPRRGPRCAARRRGAGNGVVDRFPAVGARGADGNPASGGPAARRVAAPRAHSAAADRMPAPRIRAATASGLPGDGEVVVRTLPTAAREAAYIADQLRRAHLTDGVPWSEMAVLARSPVLALPALRRAFAHAGVPMAVSGQDDGLVDEPVVATLLCVLRCALEPAMLTGQVAVDLLASPAGAMDVEALRRLRRALRAARPAEGPPPICWPRCWPGAPLPDGLAGGPDSAGAPDPRNGATRRGRALPNPPRRPACGRSGNCPGWRSPCSPRRCVAVERVSGPTATLDAVLAVFGMAAELADRMPMAGVGAFVDWSRANGFRVIRRRHR